MASPTFDVIGVINNQAKNINDALGNKFTFRIHKLPQTNWKIQSFNVPGQTMPVAIQPTRFNPIPHNGLTIEFEPLVIKFLVDEDWSNYIELTNWIRQMAMPVYADTYKKLKFDDPRMPIPMSPEGGLVSDAIGIILSNESKPNLVVTYKDLFPYSIDDIVFENNVDEPPTIVCTAKFRYTWFDIDYVTPGGPLETTQKTMTGVARIA